MKRLLTLFTIVPFLAQTQVTQVLYKKASEDSGIHWTEGLNWEQVKAKAKNERKYIFVDCYATWCGPCKLMDRDVYTNENIGKIANDKLIAIKIQFDSTSDEQTAKYWFGVANMLQKKYIISGYPTFLFFSSDGEIAHRDVGYKTSKQFMEMLETALDPKENYYRLLTEYQSGNRDINDMRKLAMESKLSDRKLAMQIAEEYIQLIDKDSLMTKSVLRFMANFPQDSLIKRKVQSYKSSYLDNLNERDLLEKDILNFIFNFPYLVNSKDNFFKLFYNNGDIVDSIIERKGFSKQMVRSVIRREEINAVLFTQDGKPSIKKADWEKLKYAIAKKYNQEYAESLVTEVQPIFYKLINDWKSYANCIEKMIKDNPPTNRSQNLHSFGDAWGLNVAAWDIFQFSNDKRILEKALQWSDLAIRLDIQNSKSTPQIFDTRANLLYKLGKVKMAIEQEQQVIELDNEKTVKSGRKIGGPAHDAYLDTIDKMKRGEPTWPLNDDGKR